MKKLLPFILTTLMLFSLTACGIKDAGANGSDDIANGDSSSIQGSPEDDSASIPTETSDETPTDTQPATVENEDGSTTEQAYFGTYTVPADWVYFPDISTDIKRFYVKDGTYTSDANPPNNISIEIGTNRYSLDQHDEFRYAIAAQLAAQAQDGQTIQASGTYTENDYALYEYYFVGSDDEVSTAQYYIVGEYCFILVHATIFDPEASDTLDIARQIVDSFTWSGDMEPA